ncbi:MAG TPA: tRNA-dihydrouridine synthase [Candidatus Thermoplasmatota archaeon]|nr:tRNA-dihydrouridine synthase [Candidatus Thermoplasmatota archaeon]
MTLSFFLKTLKQKRLILPPLSGYTDYPYRTILARFHPPFLITEMANARAVVSNNRRTKEILRIADGPHQNGVQLIGGDPVSMKKAAVIVQDLGFDYLDINMGCTVRRVVSRGEGVSLMKQEARACEIVSGIASAVSVPITCKLRLGTTRQHVNVLSLSKKLVDAGAVALTIHGRTGEKKFGIPVDFSMVKEVAAQLSAPVVANGGINTGEDAMQILRSTGATAIMPGRALIGNPWLIIDIEHAFTHKPFAPPSLTEKKEICQEHLQELIDFYGERSAVHKMRSIVPHYFSSCLFLKQLKRDVHRAESAQDILHLLSRLTEQGHQMQYDPIVS